MTVEDRLDRIERLLCSLVSREQVRQWYSVDEFARIVGRSEFTCREWCRLRRIAADKVTVHESMVTNVQSASSREVTPPMRRSIRPTRAADGYSTQRERPHRKSRVGVLLLSNRTAGRPVNFIWLASGTGKPRFGWG